MNKMSGEYHKVMLQTKHLKSHRIHPLIASGLRQRDTQQDGSETYSGLLTFDPFDLPSQGHPRSQPPLITQVVFRRCLVSES